MRARRRLLLAAGIAAALSVPASGQDDLIRVAAGADLQAALDRARPGDTILLEAGARFSGNFVLPVHEGTRFVTIRTAGDGLPNPGERTSPRHAPALAHLQSPNNGPALRTAPAAHHWRIENVAFGPNRNGDGNIIALGDGEETVRGRIPHTLVLDRVYVYGDPANGQKRGIALNSGSAEILNSYIADIKSTAVDTQAIGGWNGPGPYRIENNYLEAAGENVMFGGADPAIRDLLPQDITITRNHITRPVSWREPLLAAPAGLQGTGAASGGRLPAGTYVYKVIAERQAGRGETAVSAPAELEVRLETPGAVTLRWTPVEGAAGYRVYRGADRGRSVFFTATEPRFTDTGAQGTPGSPRSRPTVWQVKNLLELKMGRNVRIDGNLFEHHWAGAQSGYAFVFKPTNQGGRAPWTTIENIEFTNNVVRHVGGGINVNGIDTEQASVRGRGVVIRNNLFVIDKTTWGGPGDFVQIGNGPAAVVIERNTVVHDGRMLSLYGSKNSPRIEGLIFRGNVLRHNQYGVKGDGTGVGRQALEAFAPDAVFEGNVIAGGDRSSYPPGNEFVGAGALDTFLTAAAVAGPGARAQGQRAQAGADFDALAAAFSASTNAPAAPAPPRRSTG